MKARQVLFAFVVIALTVCLYAKSQPTFQTGKLLDISSDERVIDGTEYKRAVYQVQIGDLVYFGRGERITKNTADPGHGLIVGDPVRVAVDGDNLILQRPDGKQIKTKIIKRVRAENPKSSN
jgi:hypothetical protein